MISPTMGALLVTAGLLLALAGVAWRYRSKPGAPVFAVLQAGSACWVALTVVGLTLSPGSLRLRVWGATIGASLLVGLLWLSFILSYTGRDRWLAPRRFGLLSAPLAVGAGLYGAVPQWSGLVGGTTQETIAAGTVIDSSLGPVGLLLGVYLYLVFLTGLALILKTLLEGPRLFVGQALAILLGSLVTIVAGVLTIAGVPTGGYPLTQLMLTGQALLWGYAVFGQELLRVVPAVAEIGQRAVFDEVDDGMLVVDDDGTIIRSNAAAGVYLGPDELTGAQFGELLGLPGVSIREDLPVRIQRDGRTYQLRASTIRNWRNDPVGYTVVVQDVTLLVRRQQRLEVLNRILRHNVRNDMNVVMMIGEDLRDRDDATLAEAGEMLYRRADELTTISEKALEIDRAFDRPGVTRRVDPAVLVEDIVPSLAARHPDATIRTATVTDTLLTDPHVLSLVLEEVVENALEHTGDAPEVRLEVSDTDDGIEITVTDDGPGIPRVEYSPLIRGGETALEHASSLGLWVVHWGVQSLGGEVDIDTGDDGSTVTLSIPDMARFDERTDESATDVPVQTELATPGILRGSPETNI